MIVILLEKETTGKRELYHAFYDVTNIEYIREVITVWCPRTISTHKHKCPNTRQPFVKSISNVLIKQESSSETPRLDVKNTFLSRQGIGQRALLLVSSPFRNQSEPLLNDEAAALQFVL